MNVLILVFLNRFTITSKNTGQIIGLHRSEETSEEIAETTTAGLGKLG